jgi:fatty acid desaturase
MHDEGRRRARPAKIEWPTLALILACYGLWAATGLFLFEEYLLVSLLVLSLTVAMHSSLMHEASHGHPTRKGILNEILVGLPIGLVYPYRRFKTLHLQHHADENLTDPFDDPESYYRALWQHRDLPRWLQILLAVNNTMVGRFIIGPVLANVAFLGTDLKLLAAGNKAVQKAWWHHVIGLAIVLPVIQFGFGLPLWLYVLVPVWLGQSFIAIRTFAEHQWSERPDGRTVIIERSPLALLFLNNNLHLVHHKMPTAPWYKLPALYTERCEEWRRMNNGYVYPNYFALVKAYAFRAKEPVIHPFLRRAPDLGRAFRPRMRSRSVHGTGTAAVPAQPPRE